MISDDEDAEMTTGAPSKEAGSSQYRDLVQSVVERTEYMTKKMHGGAQEKTVI